MTVKVGINGFGRIGRNYLRAVLESKADIEVVAINDLLSTKTNAHLLRYDSTQGRLKEKVEVKDDALVVDGKEIAIFAERNPADIPWGKYDVDVVIESTGRFTKRTDAASHLESGVKKVIISGPSGDADATFVVGVNDQDYDKENHDVISCASCTTNCFVPMVKVLDDTFGVEHGLMTTIHAYTNDQELLDLGRDNLRRARAAAVNIVPTTTGAARATSLVLTAMKGRLDGHSLRVPVPVGSITDFTAIVSGDLNVEKVNEAFQKAASEGPISKVLVYSDEEIVSSDIVGTPASCTFDSKLTLAMPLGNDTTLVKVFGWYDNEWGYSNRLVDMTQIVVA
ncbi:MAG: type I glyceraldehyde-3-phosphate dehydrogenase [Firmicutes bacterium]|jgi:glyceraldehyde 3-phosphate dehydrogenase|nr:type I glyceraldehyde-3-phosphate dehydrogenase [Bacillota bacterium]